MDASVSIFHSFNKSIRSCSSSSSTSTSSPSVSSLPLHSSSVPLFHGTSEPNMPAPANNRDTKWADVSNLHLNRLISPFFCPTLTDSPSSLPLGLERHRFSPRRHRPHRPLTGPIPPQSYAHGKWPFGDHAAPLPPLPGHGSSQCCCIRYTLRLRQWPETDSPDSSRAD